MDSSDYFDTVQLIILQITVHLSKSRLPYDIDNRYNKSHTHNDNIASPDCIILGINRGTVMEIGILQHVL